MFLSKLTYYLTLFSTSSDASRICTIIICYGLVHKLIIRLFTQFQLVRGVKTGYKRVVHKQFFDNSKKLSVCALLHFFFFLAFLLSTCLLLRKMCCSKVHEQFVCEISFSFNLFSDRHFIIFITFCFLEM